MKNRTNVFLRDSLKRVAFYLLACGLLLTTPVLLAQSAAAQEEQSNNQQDKNKKNKDAPKLAGKWNLNEELSDDARAKMQEMMKSRGGTGQGSGMGGPPPGGGMGGPPPGGGGFPGDEMPSREQMEAIRERMERSLDAPGSLEITQSEGEITISESGGESDRARSFYLDGRKDKQSDSAGKAKFKKSQLIVETKSDRNPKIVETYELSEDGKQLIVIVKVESNFGGEIKLRRVYDAAD